MSERTRGSHVSGVHPEAQDLTELHAAKTQEALRPKNTDTVNTDLASSSIQPIGVVRLSARPEKRKLTPPPISTAPDCEHATESTVEQRPSSKRGQSHGILTNPYFPYKGGLFERLIALVANLIRYLERNLLASLHDRTPPAPIPQTVLRTKKRDAAGREIDEERERSQEREPPLKGSPR